MTTLRLQSQGRRRPHRPQNEDARHPRQEAPDVPIIEDHYTDPTIDDLWLDDDQNVHVSDMVEHPLHGERIGHLGFIDTEEGPKILWTVVDGSAGIADMIEEALDAILEDAVSMYVRVSDLRESMDVERD